MGYRGFDERGIDPRWCFGHGLSYTRFHWQDAKLGAASVSLDELDRDGLSVSIEVENAGDRAGDEVVQCYVHDTVSTLRRPRQELRGFAKVHLEPGERTTVTIPLSMRSFAAWDQAQGDWVVAPGVHEVRLGASSRDIRAAMLLKITD